MSQAVHEKILALLDESGVHYRTVTHEPARTSEASARARGEDLRIGGKALLIKTNKEFRLFVLSAACRLDSGAIRKHLKARKTRFATAAELMEKTGLVSGAVPPFGEPILPFPLYVDSSILKNEKIAFNAGSLCDSIILSVEDYLKLTNAESFEFSR
jgi:Ala-tRNA(Pro) deacylase